MPSSPVTCNGVKYPSLASLAANFSLRVARLASRLTLGWTPEQAVGLEPRKRPLNKRHQVLHMGVAYDSLVAASLDLGLKPATVSARVRNGYSITAALAGNLTPHIGNRAKPIEFRGQMYATHEELCIKHGQRWSNVQRRIKRGWSIEQALLIEPAPPRFRNHEGHSRDHKWKEVQTTNGQLEPVPDVGGFKLYVVTNKVNGKEYVGITVNNLDQRLKQHFAAAKRGRKSAFSNAMRKYGLSAFAIELIRADAQTYVALQDQEVKEIVRRDCIRNGYNTAKGGSIGTAKSITVAGQDFSSYAAAANLYGVDPAVFSMRLNRLKWTPEQAAGIEDKNWSGKKIPITIRGQHYPSLTAAAKATEVNYKLLHSRHFKLGWTIEQSAGLTQAPASSKFSGRALNLFGTDYTSIAQAARALGLSAEGFRKLIREGMSPEEAYERARKNLPI